MLRQARVYGGSQYKFEPKELRNTLAAAVAQLLTEGTVMDGETQVALTKDGRRPGSHERAKRPDHTTRAARRCMRWRSGV